MWKEMTLIVRYTTRRKYEKNGLKTKFPILKNHRITLTAPFSTCFFPSLSPYCTTYTYVPPATGVPLYVASHELLMSVVSNTIAPLRLYMQSLYDVTGPFA